MRIPCAELISCARLLPAQLLLDGDYTSIDLSIFGCDRLLARPPSQVLERNIV
jgi:hypothetical protein